MKPGKQEKNGLSETEKKDCDTFKEARHKCGMTQEQWSSALGISFGLVKAIENHARKCSGKTKNRVMKYMSGRNGDHDFPDTLSLESHVMEDLFLAHMRHIPKKASYTYAAYCAKQMLKLLASADSLETADAQGDYVKFLIQALSVLSIGAHEAARAVNSGENILEPAAGLDAVFKKNLTKKYLSSGDIQVSANGQINVQQSLDDF